MTAPAVSVQGTVLVAGKNKSVPLKAIDNSDGTFTLVVDIGGAASVTLTASELEIGHVALKNNQTEEHQTISVDGGARDATHPLEGALQLAYDPTADVYRVMRIDSERVIKTSLPNRPGFAVREIDTLGVANIEKVGPAFVVPDGHAVFVEAESTNTSDVRIGGVGETGAAATRRDVSPGDAFPVAVRVQNLNQIAAQSAGLNQKVRLIVEKV